MRLGAWLALFIAAVGITGCGPRVVKLTANTYVWDAKGITVQLPPGEWSAEQAPGKDMIVFRRNQEPGRLAIQVTPAGLAKPSAESVLARQLLLGFQEKEVVGTSNVQVGRQAPDAPPFVAACMLVRAQVDDTPVMIRACALSRAGRIYDLVCWAAPADFPAVNRLFEEFLKGVSFHEPPMPTGEP